MQPSKPLKISKEKNRLLVPAEIYVQWGQPKFIITEVASGEICLHVKNELSFMDRVKTYLKSNLLIARARFDSETSNIIFTDSNDLIPEGKYMPINYHPMYCLHLAKNDYKQKSVADQNAATWAAIEGYHEHLPLELQQPEALSISNLFVEEIKKAIGNSPDSILELGCGSGRNLYHLGNAFPETRILGIDINLPAISRGNMPCNVERVRSNVLDLNWQTLGNFDAILTSGFLMHINHIDVRKLMTVIHQHSGWHFHYELHGPSHDWDFHRYPRSYSMLMEELSLPFRDYRILLGNSHFSAGLTKLFAHAFLISTSQS